MADTKHTPGSFTAEFGETIAIRSADGSRLATVTHLRGPGGRLGRIPIEEAEANARLFAAAPDLLAALSQLMQQLEDFGYVGRRPLEGARAAIAKVEAVPRSYTARWDDSFRQPATKTVGSEFFTEANGYDAEDRAAIAALQLGERWADPQDGEHHTVTRSA